jgi:threo-3-hydroxy-L-aspartate ammonia-lyase
MFELSALGSGLQAARARLRGQAHRTPVVTSRTLDERVGAQVFLKCENLQRVGAFKFRGAWNAIAQLPAAVRARGVLAYSSGNHAQAVALVARLHGIQAVIVMPANAPAAKLAATAGYGAEIITYDPTKESREPIAEELVSARGFTLIPPFDHLDVVLGQGTAAAELIEECGPLDYLLVPCGGGGLLSGSAIAARTLSPGCRVIGVEPALGDDANRSFRSKTLQTVHNPQTIADGTRTPSLGERVTLPLVLAYVDDMVTVSEEAIAAAVRFLFYRTKLVVEPSGALPVAALLDAALPVAGRVGVVLSGGNVDGATMAAILT